MKSGQTVIVTGSSRGLGAATATIAAGFGAGVVLNSRTEGVLSAVASEIENDGGKVLSVPGDVTQLETCSRIVKYAIDKFGRIDAVVNNAGMVLPIAGIADCTPEAWESNWKVNLLSAVMMTKEALPYLRRSSGRVISVTTSLATTPMPGMAAYCAAKSALNQFMKVLAEEEKQVTAIAFDPGIVDTSMQERIRDHGVEGLSADMHSMFVGFHTKRQLLPPEMPGLALAALALSAPQEMNGTCVIWNDDEVQKLVESFR